MTFDPWSGTIWLDELDLEVGPRLTRTAFEANPVHDRFKVLVRNEPYCSYSGRASVHGEPFYVDLWFHGPGRIWRLTLGTARPEIVGQNWGDYDLGAAVDLHERWTDRALGLQPSDHPAATLSRPYVGPKRQVGWATICVGVDPHNGDSSIVVDYRRQPSP